ncbi:sortase [Acrocarpospora catenulata]|uniref:sortase n=1 Tax=Acrocarpospora catenulata TaxID=2836182 RepID=UPI001BDB2111|nr:sortase [Acrocarpospora catenulata]
MSAGDPALTAAVETAVRTIERLEATVDRAASGLAPHEHANALVIAGSASVLLGQLELAAPRNDESLRERTTSLRSRYDSALLRLGGAPAPAPYPYPAVGTASWVQVAPGQFVMAPAQPLMPYQLTQPMMAPQMAPPVGPQTGPTMTPPTSPTMAPPMGPTMAPPTGPGMAPPMGPGMTPPMGPGMGPMMASPMAVPFPGVGAPPVKTRRKLSERIDALPPEARRAGKAALNAVGIMGVLLIAFTFYASWFGHLMYERNQRIMLDALNDDLTAAATIAAAPQATDRDLTAIPERGKPIALLEIPKLGLREVIVQGTGTAELRAAVGHYRPSPMPGQSGNAVLAGHRNLYGSPFSRLGEMAAGDKIVATTQEGQFTFTVELVEQAGTGRDDFLGQETFVNRLTLLTTSEDAGSGGRLAVVSRLDGQPASLKTVDPSQPKSDELGLGRDTSAWGAALGWGGLLLALLAGTIHLYRIWRRASAYLITTPPLLAVGLLWFEALARLIPSTY